MKGFNHYAEAYLAIAANVGEAIVETSTNIERDVKGRAPKSEAGASAHGGAKSAPYKTGNLRRSYHQDRKGLRDALEPHVEIGSDPGIAEYAVYVEYGTSKMAPRPHLTPSSEAQRAMHALRVAAAVSGATSGGGFGGFARSGAGASGLPAKSGALDFGLGDY